MYCFNLKSLVVIFFLSQCVQVSQQNLFTFFKSLIVNSRISMDKNRIRFSLHPIAEHTDQEEEIELGNIQSLRHSSFNASLPVKVIIHGFLTNKRNGVLEALKAAYLAESYEINLISVDWKELSTPISVLPQVFYPAAAKNVEKVGIQLSNFLQFLMKTHTSIGPENIHLIGFSLGSHIAGIAGMNFFKDTGKLLERITGLDPAGPLFQFWAEEDRLDTSDAKFVDITHTNKDFFGFNRPLGHVDFYANGGGPMQPGCSALGTRAGSCAHADAYIYFAKSIEWEIPACSCPEIHNSTAAYHQECKRNCKRPILYGERCSHSVRGEYYFEMTVLQEFDIGVTKPAKEIESRNEDDFKRFNKTKSTI